MEKKSKKYFEERNAIIAICVIVAIVLLLALFSNVRGRTEVSLEPRTIIGKAFTGYGYVEVPMKEKRLLSGKIQEKKIGIELMIDVENMLMKAEVKKDQSNMEYVSSLMKSGEKNYFSEMYVEELGNMKMEIDVEKKNMVVLNRMMLTTQLSEILLLKSEDFVINGKMMYAEAELNLKKLKLYSSEGRFLDEMNIELKEDKFVGEKKVKIGDKEFNIEAEIGEKLILNY